MGIGTKADVMACRDALAAAAQGAYDAWEQGEDGIDPELGEGGACDDVAARMLSALADRFPDMDLASEYVEADCHTVVMARADDGVLRVNVPAGVYETGTGYRWRKIPGVTFTPDDVSVEVLSPDPGDFPMYVGDPSPSYG